MIHKPIRLLQKYFDSLNFSELVYRVEEDGAHSCFTILVIDAYGGLWPLRYIAGANSSDLQCGVFGVAKIPDSIRVEVLEKLNEIAGHSFIKVFIDRNNELVASSDMLLNIYGVDDELLGPTAMNILLRMTYFFREDYPEVYEIIRKTENDIGIGRKE